MKPLVIGSRGSPLALKQASIVADLLGSSGIETRVEKIRTSGDRPEISSLAEHGGKGLFTKELELALAKRTIDLAVHSLKDVPTQLHDKFSLAAFLPRGDPRDCLIAGEGCSSIKDLPQGCTVGTSSPRRAAQLLLNNPQVRIKPLRGNVETRLEKVRSGELGATLLAKAGLDRLGISDPEWIHPLLLDIMLPAAGQGTLVVEILADRFEELDLLKAIDDPDSRDVSVAERSVVSTLGGTCTSPIAAYGTIEAGQLHLEACVADETGEHLIRDRACGERDNPGELGRMLANQLLSAGASEWF